ncbi:MAG: GYD domain superfamily [Hadesarchaea archaeon]|nr:MAG: GYD domain superfamily [Hadesarchaea archaeon]
MPTYILLSILTAEGRKTLKEKPNRIFEVNREIEAFGAKVLKQYAVLGPYDFVNVVEAPDNETIAKISIELGSRGTLKVMSLPAVPVEEFIEKIRRK